MKNPCSICELYAVGEKCDNERKCPVANIKKENALLKRRVHKLEACAPFDNTNMIGDKHEMGSW